MKFKHLILIFISLAIISCGKESNDAEESFKMWLNLREIPKEFEIMNGQFWKSTHFTYEYITFLHFKAPKTWVDEFIKLNDLKIATGKQPFPDDAPDWFAPYVGQKVYVQKGFTQGSMYFVNEKTGEVFFYEIQL